MYQLVMAHPDDEIIFGWMVLKETSDILICSSDFHNSEREWCKHRKEALFEVCEKLGIKCECLDYDSEFYRLSTRDEALKRMAVNVQSRLMRKVFTHNPWGEYGHLDHILISQWVKGHCSDILMQSNWMPVKRHGLGQEIKKAEWDENFYQTIKGIYVKHNVWTWDKEPVKEAYIYENSHSL